MATPVSVFCNALLPGCCCPEGRRCDSTDVLTISLPRCLSLFNVAVIALLVVIEILFHPALGNVAECGTALIICNSATQFLHFHCYSPNSAC